MLVSLPTNSLKNPCSSACQNDVRVYLHCLNWIEEEERSIQFGVWKNSYYELCLSSCVNNRKKHCLCPLSTHNNRQTLIVCSPFFLFFFFSSTWMALMFHLQGWVGGGAGLLHTLSLVPGPVIWIVIEAGGVTNETASLLTQARVHRLVHLGLEKESTITTPGNSEEEEQELQLETRLRIKGLRFVHSEVARTETLPFVVGLYSVLMH